MVVTLAALLCLPWLARPFHTRGEPREALVAQAMIDTGNWVSPPAYDGAVPSKPPFSHWLIALASLPGGEVTEATSRLPSALAVILFSAAFFVFLAARLPVASATGASLILLASSEWFRSASTCRVDTLLATSMAGALLCLFRWWEREFRGIPWLAIVLVGCAALTKGPVGIVLPLGLFSLFCWIRQALTIRALMPVVWRGLALVVPVVAIISVWYVLGFLERGEAFIEKVRYENFERFTSSMADEPHKHSAFYLLGMLAMGLLPWSLSLVCVLRPTLLSKVRSCHVRSCMLKAKGIRSWWQGLSPLYQFSWIVTVGIVAFFCIPSSKRSVYLLPAYPFIALLCEQGIRQLEARYAGALCALTRVVMWGVAALTVTAAIMYAVPLGGIKFDIHAFVASLSLTKVFFTAIGLVMLSVVLRETIREMYARPLERVAIVVVASVVMISLFIYDTVAWQLSPKRWVLEQELQKALSVAPAPKLYSYGSEAYGASFYLNASFSRATKDGVPIGSLVFLEERKLSEFQQSVASRVEYITRYSSGLDSPKRDVVVVRVGEPS